MLTVQITQYIHACGQVVAYSPDGAYATVRDGSRTYTGRVVDRLVQQPKTEVA